MGESITQQEFNPESVKEFKQKLREETKVLKKYFDQREFEFAMTPKVGLEVEAWLMDQNFIPNPINEKFIGTCNHEAIVEELSQFNFEINSSPIELSGDFLSSMEGELNQVFAHARQCAEKLNSKFLLVGTNPFIKEEMLTTKYLSKGDRYKCLNEQILKMRDGEPIHMDIQGFDQLKLDVDHIMLEAAATSIQVHIQCNQENMRRVMNASMIASCPTVAIAANSPFLFGKSLWDESRIPLFEQSVRINSFRDKKGENISRVFFGTGYIRHNGLEPYLENLDGFDPLMPIIFDDQSENLRHLNFHNGTIWRWNRPIIGKNKSGDFHLRVEQRVMASGPSVIDIAANAAFAIGLTKHLSDLEKAPEESMTFTDCKNNFYSAAKDGLKAQVRWFGKNRRLDEVILNDLIPMASEGLRKYEVSETDIEHYLGHIMRNRVLKGQNGATWQRAFIANNGPCMQTMIEEYHKNQEKNQPVHDWTV